MFVAALGTLSVLNYGQTVSSRRDAFGSERAGQVEQLLAALFPGKKVEWEPVLGIRSASGVVPVDLGNFTTTQQSDGTTAGVAALEVGTNKSEHIKELHKSPQTKAAPYTSTIVVFRIDSSNRISAIKKVSLDPSDPLTKINWFEVHSWPAGKWPVLRIRYTSYMQQGGASLASIEWGGLLDTNTSSFVARVPTGMFLKQDGAQETGDILSVQRTSPNQILIVGNTTKKSIPYPCPDPCIVNGRQFLALWSK